jgi:HAD superfamily hydrolase (TIGR01549 family)
MKRMVIFDFDGVIADSFWLAHKTTKKKFPNITVQDHLDGFEGNIVQWENTVSHLEKADIDYEAEIEKEMHLVDFFEVEEAIVEISKKYRLAIVSSARTAMIRAYLEREGLLGYFEDILGWDVHESKHHKINGLIEKYSLTPNDCIMVTDTSGDVREAQMAGVDSIVVSWGYHDMARLKKVPYFKMVHKPEELVPTIEEYFAK